jgi:hypothetical protein
LKKQHAVHDLFKTNQYALHTVHAILMTKQHALHEFFKTDQYALHTVHAILKTKQHTHNTKWNKVWHNSIQFMDCLRPTSTRFIQLIIMKSKQHAPHAKLNTVWQSSIECMKCVKQTSTCFKQFMQYWRQNSMHSMNF